MSKKDNNPSAIFEQYNQGQQFKSGLGSRGMYDQNKMNERFFVGDQWYGAQCGNDRPLVRHNVIKRIGDYKMAVVGSNPIAVNYSAEGVPNTIDLKERITKIREGIVASDPETLSIIGGMDNDEVPHEEEISLVMSAMSDYFRVTAERVKFDDIREQALRNSYISGTGVVYTYWDESIRTGLYANESRTTAIKGDIAVEVLDIENVYFGDPNCDDIQKQPYILIAQRRSVSDLKREARRNRRPSYEIDKIQPDRDTGMGAGQISDDEPAESCKATVITKFWKEYDDDSDEYKIKAIRVCQNVIIRDVWDIGIRLYPFAKFTWERRRNCAYGESEITYLIPNQIAVNRMVSASVWAVMMMGMPIMVVNQDIITQDISNDPGQIIAVNGGLEDVQGAMRYVNPPNFSPSFSSNVNDLIANTMNASGANDAALGEMRPENTSAIIALREAATMPMQQVQNRYYSFCEDIARVWAEFWVMHYGKRSLKVEDDNGVWYLPFNGDRYKDLLIASRIDVGASTLWGESQSIRTLDNLLDRQVIDEVQYLTRLPKGVVPNVNKLIQELRNARAAAEQQAMQTAGQPTGGDPEQTQLTEEDVLSGITPENRQMLDSFDPNVRAALLRAAMNAQSVSPETMPSGAVV